MWDILVKGGIVMVPIGLCSVLALAFLLERLWALRRARVVPARLLDAVASPAPGARVAELPDPSESEASPLGRVLAAGLARRHAGRSRDEVREAFEEAGRREATQLTRYLDGLSTIASIAPLLGLLGTVLGIIGVFQTVVDEGVGDAKMLAAGIWEALITTAAGLVVAIPAFVAHRYLAARVDALVGEMEHAASELLERLWPPPGAAPARPHAIDVHIEEARVDPGVTPHHASERRVH